MKRAVIWNAKEAAAATGGKGAGDWAATGLSIDIDTVQKGDLFIALDGPQDVIPAIRKGACAVITEKKPRNAPQNLPLLFVPDTAGALYDLGQSARLRCGAKIVGVSGDHGAVQAGAIIAAALGACGQTHAQGHEVPVSLSAMHAGADYAVFEIGGASVNEMAFWAWHVRPHIAIVTGGRREILEGLEQGGALILNRDDADYAWMRSLALSQGIKRIYTFGRSEQAHAALTRIMSGVNGSRIEARILGEPVSFRIGGGETEALYALAALLSVSLAGACMKKARAAMESLAMERPESAANVALFENAQGVSAASRRAAFRVLALIDPGRGRRRIAVLRDAPDLLHPGQETINDLSLPLKAADVDLLYTNAPRKTRKGQTKDKILGEIVPDVLGPGDVLMVKGGKKSGVKVETLRAVPYDFAQEA